MIQIPQVQTAIAEKAIDILTEHIDGNITFEKVHFKPFNTLVLKNVVITDKHPISDPTDPTKPKIDTLARIEYLVAKFTLSGLLDKESIKIKEISLSNAQMNLVLEDYVEPDGTISTGNNLSRIFRLYQQEKTEPKNKELFNIQNIKVSNTRFSLLNYCTEKTAYRGGIDWNNLVVNDINLLAHNLRFKNGIMYGDAEKLSAIPL